MVISLEEIVMAATKKPTKKVEKKTKVTTKKVEKPTKAEAKKVEKPIKEEVDAKVLKQYHVSKREDGRWQVKNVKAEKALKIFRTQAEAIAYAKTVAGNQDGSIRVHSKAGKLRKAK